MHVRGYDFDKNIDCFPLNFALNYIKLDSSIYLILSIAGKFILLKVGRAD